MEIETVHALQRDRKFIAPGTVMDLPDEEAQELLDSGAVRDPNAVEDEAGKPKARRRRRAQVDKTPAVTG